mmetsp:Transcript_31079/g.76070  ORF Transcript_31079/g.76070 Transcript_31079/m.76070 type:complete len:237 (-) Transcript_31079:231-941(-)
MPVALRTSSQAHVSHSTYSPASCTSGATVPSGARSATSSVPRPSSASTVANAAAVVSVALHMHDAPSMVGCTVHAPGHDVPSALAVGAARRVPPQRTRKKLFEFGCRRESLVSGSTRPMRPDGYTCTCTWHGSAAQPYTRSAHELVSVGAEYTRSPHSVRFCAAQRRSATAYGTFSLANRHSPPNDDTARRRSLGAQHMVAPNGARGSPHWRVPPRRTSRPSSMMARRTHGTFLYV